jgi:hypothetical protein
MLLSKLNYEVHKLPNYGCGIDNYYDIMKARRVVDVDPSINCL